MKNPLVCIVKSQFVYHVVQGQQLFNQGLSNYIQIWFLPSTYTKLKKNIYIQVGKGGLVSRFREEFLHKKKSLFGCLVRDIFP